jgi:hypothetical protein
MKALLPTIVAAAGFVLGFTDQASAFPRTHENASLTLTFSLAAPPPSDPNAPAPVNPPTGTATVDVNRVNGVETDSTLDFTLANVADGTYDVSAILKGDPTQTPFPLGSIKVAANQASLALVGPPALDIATLNVSTQGVPPDPQVQGSTGTPGVVILTGTPSENIAYWRFFGNRPVFGPGTPDKHGKMKPIHGHVLVQARIVNNVETRRKFLLVAHNGPADTTLTIKLDGVVAGTFGTTKNGKMMTKALVLPNSNSTVRLAGVHILTICQADGTVVATADFFPNVP